jgi:DNA-binding Lrp family transcriptional regulator
LPTRAFILIETEVGRAKQVAEALRSVPEVLAADVITGSFDVIATIEAPNMSAMAEVVTGQVQSIRGVRRTITCVSAG